MFAEMGFTELVLRKATNRSKVIPIPKNPGGKGFFSQREKGSVRTIYL